MASNKRTRRNFIATSLAVASTIVGGSIYQKQTTSANENSQASELDTSPAASSASSTSTSSNRASSDDIAARSDAPPVPTMPEHILGRTGVQVPILGLGGAGQTPLSRPNEEREALELIEQALELGIQYFDTAANYGPSEERLGKVLPAYRSEIFLASKTGARDRDRAWRELERSLNRLQTDHLDLWQFHALTYEWDVNTILDEQQGAIKAAQEASEQGIIKFLGISGHHNPDIMAEALQRYPFDTALIPVNAADIHNPNPFITRVLPVAQQQNTGIIAMKVPAYGRLLKPGILQDMHQAMGYALSQPGVDCCIIAAETVSQLQENVRVAQAFHPLADQELAAIEQLTADRWKEDGSFFRDWV